MKKIFGVLVFSLVCLAAFPQEDGFPPINYFYHSDGICITLHGETFYSSKALRASFKEQDGYAIVLGRKLHYWLYDTYSEHKETLIKGLTPFNSVSLLFLNVQYNKVDSEHLRNNRFKRWALINSRLN